MSDRAVLQPFQFYAEALTINIDEFGDMQSDPNTDPESFEILRDAMLTQIKMLRKLLKETESQVKMLQLREK